MRGECARSVLMPGTMSLLRGRGMSVVTSALLAGWLAALADPSSLYACTCARYPPEIKVQYADHVFVGRVMSVGPALHIRSASVRISQWHVYQRWRGAELPVMVLYTPYGGTNCGIDLMVGRDYLVYAYDGGELAWEMPYSGGRCDISLAEFSVDDQAALGAPEPLGNVCPTAHLPNEIAQLALDEPWRFHGWGLARDIGKPAGPANPYRTWLTVSRPSLRYHPVFNRPAWRVGCY
jgi:hypothetical protein